MRSILLFFLTIATAFPATWYVDKDATGSANGTSWANAWTSLAAIGTTPAAGDTVNISGGTAGATNTYTQTSTWIPKSGTSGNPITYKSSSEAGHNGYAKFHMSTTIDWVNPGSWVVISGDVGDAFDTSLTSAGHCHIILENENEPCDATGTTGVRFGYVNCGLLDKGIQFSDATQLEVDHCWYKKTAASADDFALKTVNATGATWDVNKIHHNVFWVIQSGCGDGDDGIQGIGNGVSVYNNWFLGFNGTYTGTQHGDAIQPTSGSFLKIYNNYFRDWGNYGVFVDAYFGDVTHCWVFNNFFTLTDSGLQDSACAAPRGVLIGPDGGAFANLGRWPAFTDVILCNNLAADYGNKTGLEFDQNGGGGSTFTSCFAENNITINSGSISLATGITTNQNVQFTSAQATSHVVSYSNLSASNDFHPKTGDSTLLDTATSFASYFTTDYEGNTRPQGSAWDIGPLELVSGGGGTTGGGGASSSQRAKLSKGRRR